MLEAVMLLLAVVVVDGWQECMLTVYPGQHSVESLVTATDLPFLCFLKLGVFLI